MLIGVPEGGEFLGFENLIAPEGKADLIAAPAGYPVPDART